LAVAQQNAAGFAVTATIKVKRSESGAGMHREFF
jgi:hypothetical protein